MKTQAGQARTATFFVPPGTAAQPSHGRGVFALSPWRALGLLLGLFTFVGSSAAQPAAPAASSSTAAPAAQPEKSRMWMTIGERRFAFNLANTEAARAFAAMMPLTIDMPDLNSNEKHAKLPKSLPTSTTRPGTIRSGDLMLYGSETLVVFYVTFDSAYSYTRLGSVDDTADLAQALGKGTARITFTKR
jgi:hypothetical protein